MYVNHRKQLSFLAVSHQAVDQRRERHLDRHHLMSEGGLRTLYSCCEAYLPEALRLDLQLASRYLTLERCDLLLQLLNQGDELCVLLNEVHQTPVG